MQIAGLQKLTLLDYPGLVACTIFLPGCNLRCPFCHNSALVLPEAADGGAIGEEELFAFLKKRRGTLDGVCITGGEPLIHADILPLLEKIRALGYKIKLDTNGTFPDRLAEIIAAGLADKVAMDIKNDPAQYAAAAGVAPDMTAITRSKQLLLSGKTDCEFRTTVVKGIHTAESIENAARYIAGAREYYLQQYKQTDGVIAPDGLDAFDENQMLALRDAARKFVPNTQVRGL